MRCHDPESHPVLGNWLLFLLVLVLRFLFWQRPKSILWLYIHSTHTHKDAQKLPHNTHCKSMPIIFNIHVCSTPESKIEKSEICYDETTDQIRTTTLPHGPLKHIPRCSAHEICRAKSPKVLSMQGIAMIGSKTRFAGRGLWTCRKERKESLPHWTEASPEDSGRAKSATSQTCPEWRKRKYFGKDEAS